jgi:hypothetical protein
MTDLFWGYYLICAIYCFYKMIKMWNKNYMPGGLGISPGLDTVMLVFMSPILAPIDVALTWVRLYKETEEFRKKQRKLF